MTRPARTKRKRRLGIFGGTFSPIHNGHLICAESVREEAGLDEIAFAPSASPPNKPFGVLDAEDRYDMTVAGTEDNPHFSTSRVDLDHEGSGYSLLTVEAIKRQYKDADLFFLSSAEYLDPAHRWYLPNWVGGSELFKLCTLLIFPRDTQELDKLHHWRSLLPHIDIQITNAPSPAISSTLIRDLIMGGKSIWYTTPWPVQQLIGKMGHYRTPETIAAKHEPVSRDKIKRVAIYASRFDPLHFGHLLFAEWVRQEMQDDRVIFVPLSNSTGDPSLARTADARYRAVVAGTADNPFFETSRADIKRNTSSYAILTVEDIRRKFGQQVEVDYIISSDYLKPDNQWYLPTWMGREQLFKQVRFLVSPEDMTEIDEVKALARKIPDAKIEVVYAPTLPVNSAQMRQRVKNGQSLRYMTPLSVQQSITKSRLYLK